MEMTWGGPKQKKSLRENIVAQFAKPSGFWGSIAGQVMVWRPSNRTRNRWAIERLGVGRAERVLDVGCGPGLALRWLSEIAVDGFVAGIDHSAVMVRQAQKRNAKAIKEGRLYVQQLSVEELAISGAPAPFDKIMAVNAQMFWEDPISALKNLRRLLKPGGCIALAHQPRTADATAALARTRGAEIAAQLQQAGFADVRLEFKEMKPVACVCAFGYLRQEERAL